MSFRIGRTSVRRHDDDPVAGPLSLGRFGCPDCGLVVKDEIAARLGFCARCQDFTGMCGAGRKVVCPDVMSVTSWHTPCTQLGAAAWQVTLRDGPCITMLCTAHDAELRSRSAPWSVEAVPVTRVLKYRNG